MLLTNIYHYIELNGRVSLLNLTRHFHLKESAIKPMLEFWVRKGKLTAINLPVSACVTNKVCADCHECDPSALQFYQLNN